MRNQVDNNKFTWIIKSFSCLESQIISSDNFVIGGCSWCLKALPKGSKLDSLSLYLVVANYKSLPCGWRRHTKFSLTIVNQRLKRLSQVKEKHKWFDENVPGSGFKSMFPLGHVVYGGFIMNDEIKIVAQIDVLEVIGQYDIVSPSEECNDNVKNDHPAAVSSGLLNKAPPLEETTIVNGFQVLPSQVDLVRLIFERHPDIVVEYSFKNQHMKTASMNIFLGLIETLCQSPRVLSSEDLVEAENALTDVEALGFKADWLVRKLEQVKEKKKEETIGEARIRVLEEELNGLKQKCSEMETLFEEEKSNVLAARAPLKLDDILDVISKFDESQEVTMHNGSNENALVIDLHEEVKHSDIALELCSKNQHLRKAYIGFLISLIKTLCKSPQELSIEDLVGAENAITYVKGLGFKVDWLVEKVEEVKEKKKQVESGESQMQELEKELKEFNQRCSDIEALLEKEKAKVFDARVPLTLDDVL